MRIEQTQVLTKDQKKEIVDLWNKEYPTHLAYKHVSEFDEYLAGLTGYQHLLVHDEDKSINAWFMTFTREQARWFSMIVDSSLQGQGIGSQLLNAAKTTETELNGWATDHDRDVKADGTAYPSPIGFYLKNDFKILEDIRLEKGELSVVKIRWRE
jgi:GNAT superfamily N-acetyltransferase